MTTAIADLLASNEALRAEVARLRALIDTPATDDFVESTKREAAHQIQRWGVEHQAAKAPSDFFWLVGYLAGKADRSATLGETDKAKHHLVAAAAVLLNWFRRLSGEDQTFQPGSNDVARLVDGDGPLFLDDGVDSQPPKKGEQT